MNLIQLGKILFYLWVTITVKKRSNRRNETLTAWRV